MKIYIPIFLNLGTSHERRKKIIFRLNSEYQALISVKVKMSGIYQYMVQSENYRVLSQYEYTKEEPPLRSGRISERPAMTDVIIIKRNIIPNLPSNNCFQSLDRGQSAEERTTRCTRGGCPILNQCPC